MVTSISKRGQEKWNDCDNIKFQLLVERCIIDLEKMIGTTFQISPEVLAAPLSFFFCSPVEKESSCLQDQKGKGRQEHNQR